MGLFLVLVAVYHLLAGLCSTGIAMDSPFDQPANWGGTGLLEVPTARVIPCGHARAGFSYVHPYRVYYGTLSPFPRLEIGARVTEIVGVEVPTWKHYGYYKDRAIDMKLQLFPEGKYRPALAFGIMDPFGTRLYGAEYLVVSKQIFPFDFTLGIGTGRLGERPLKRRSGLELFRSLDTGKDLRLFGGLEFAPSDKFSLIMEYNPILYHRHPQDPAQHKYFVSPVSSPINFGLRLKPFPFLALTFSYQRGEELGINASVNFNIGKPLYPIVLDPYEEPKERTPLPLEDRIALALIDIGMSDVGVLREGDRLYVEFQNDTYLYPSTALGMVLWTLEKLLPEEIHWVELLYKRDGIPLFAFAFSKDDMDDFYQGKLDIEEFYSLSKFDFALIHPPQEVRTRGARRFSYWFKPAFYTFLNDPSGFFKYRAGAEFRTGWRLLPGTSVRAEVGLFPLNNISSRVGPLSIPVRSDIVNYVDAKFILDSLMLEHLRKLPDQIWAYTALGYLEVEYAGVNLQVAKPLFEGRLLVGADMSLVYKRDPEIPLALKKDTYYTLLAKARWHTPLEGLSVDVKAGRFLAGDPGIRIQLNKDFNGVMISVWYSFTDTSIFRDPYNRGYHDKGIMVSIPLKMFLGKDSRQRAFYSISPWSRDVAQDVYHSEVFDLMEEGSKRTLDTRRDDVKMWTTSKGGEG